MRTTENHTFTESNQINVWELQGQTRFPSFASTVCKKTRSLILLTDASLSGVIKARNIIQWILLDSPECHLIILAGEKGGNWNEELEKELESFASEIREKLRDESARRDENLYNILQELIMAKGGTLESILDYCSTPRTIRSISIRFEVVEEIVKYVFEKLVEMERLQVIGNNRDGLEMYQTTEKER